MIAIWHYPKVPRESGAYHCTSDAEGKAAFISALDRASRKPGREVPLRLDVIDTKKHYRPGADAVLFTEACITYSHNGEHWIEAEEVGKQRLLIKITAVGRTHLQEAIETFNDMSIGVHRVGGGLSSRERQGSLWFW